MMQKQLAIGRLDHRLTIGNRVRILVKGMHLRTSLEHGSAVPPCPECAIDMRLARGNGERDDHFIEQNGNMAGSGSGGHFAFPPPFWPASFR